MQTNFIEIKYGTKRYHDMVALRFLVLRQPLGLTYSPQDLEKDCIYKLFALEDLASTNLIACCCLEDLHPIYRLRQMAVHPEMQNMGFGATLLHKIEDWVKIAGGQQIVMHARSYAIPFYKKSGYADFGDEFLEVGIPHRQMKKMM